MFNAGATLIDQLKITERDLTVLDLIADGHTNQEIADKLFFSKRTIEGVRESLLLKTKSRNTAALIAFAFRSGILV